MSTLVQTQRVESATDKALRDRPGTAGWLTAGIEKYGAQGQAEVFLRVENTKQAMLRAYRREQYRAQERGEDRDVQNRRCFDFFEAYEDVNRRHLPEDPTYSIAETGVVLITTGDMACLLIATTAWARVIESYIGGEAAASSVLRLGVSRSNTAATGGTATTPSKFSMFSPAAQTTTVVQATGGSILVGIPLIVHDFNTFGGTDRWVTDPNHEIYFGGAIANGNQLSWRSISGTPTVSAHQIWEEL